MYVLCVIWNSVISHTPAFLPEPVCPQLNILVCLQWQVTSVILCLADIIKRIVVHVKWNKIHFCSIFLFDKLVLYVCMYSHVEVWVLSVFIVSIKNMYKTHTKCGFWIQKNDARHAYIYCPSAWNDEIQRTLTYNAAFLLCVLLQR